MADLIDSTYFYSHVCKSSIKPSSFCVTLVNIEPKHFLRVFLAKYQNWYQEQLREQTVPRILRSRSEHYLEATSPATKPEVHTFNFVLRATTQTTVPWTNGRASARKVKGGHTCTSVANSPPLGPLSPNSSLTNWVVLASRRCSLWTGLLRRPFCSLRVTVETRPSLPGNNLSTRLIGHLPLDLFRN